MAEGDGGGRAKAEGQSARHWTHCEGLKLDSIRPLASGSPHANPEGPGSPTPTPTQTPRIPQQVWPWLLSAQRFSGDLRTCQVRRSGRTVSAGGGEDRLKDKRSPPGARGLGQSPGQHPRPASLGHADPWASRAPLTTHLWARTAADQGPAPACHLQSVAFGAPRNLDRPTGSATAGRRSLLSTGRRWPRAVQSGRGASPLAGTKSFLMLPRRSRQPCTEAPGHPRPCSKPRL